MAAARRGGGGSEGYLRGPARIPGRRCGGARWKTLGGGGSEAGMGGRGGAVRSWPGGFAGFAVRAGEVAREEEAGAGHRRTKGPQRPLPVRPAHERGV